MGLAMEALHKLGPPVVPFYPFLGESSPTKIDYRKKGALILTSLLEDLANPIIEECSIANVNAKRQVFAVCWGHAGQLFSCGG